MKFETRIVGPVEARELLSLNEGNRPVSQNNVDWISSELLAGKYKNTGDTIKICTNGKLIDGQHRLLAIVKTGKAIELNFAIGVDPDSFAVIDTGRKRTPSDIIALSGFSNPNELSAAARFIMMIKRNKLFARPTISNADILEFVTACPQIQEFIPFVKKGNKKFRMISNSAAIALYFIFSEKHPHSADDFFTQYWNGNDLEDTSPIKQLRDKFIRDSINKSRLSPEIKMVFVAACFKMYLEGRKIKRLDVDTTKFPKF